MNRMLRNAAAIAAAALLLTSCSAQSGSSDSKGTGIKMSYVAFSGMAPTLLAIDNGTYEKHGLNVEGSVAASPAAIISGLVNGEVQIGFTTIPTLITAVDQGVKIKCIASADGVGSTAPPAKVSVALIVPVGSPIKSAKELEGKKVGVLALGSLNHLVAMDLIDEDGGDASAANYVQLPLPQNADALSSGQVDAAISTEPFTLPLLNDGYRMLGTSEASGGLNSDTTTKCFAASQEFIDKNPETVDNFIKAHDKALSYAEGHREEALSMLSKVLDITPEAAKKSDPGLVFKPGIAPEDVERMQDKMIQFGWIDKKRPAEDYFYTPEVSK